MAVFSGWKPIAFHRNPEAGAQAMIMYTPSTSAAPLSLRELDSAASGSTHSTYHGRTQLSVTSRATLAHPDAVIEERRRHACTQQRATDAISAALKRTCSDCVSPPLPS